MKAIAVFSTLMIVLAIKIAIILMVASLITSALKLADSNCGVTYTIEKIGVSGNYFCPVP